MHALVAESGDRRIVVDTCVGNGKSPRSRLGRSADQLPRRPGRAGFPPESVDPVLCTHLHFDHVGWNTRDAGGVWVPTFPNARYLFGAIELTHWQQADTRWRSPGRPTSPRPAARRHEFSRRFSGPDVLIIGTHFPTPTAGHLLEADGRWRFTGVS